MNKNVKRCALVAGAFAMASMGNVYQVQASELHASEVLQQAKRQIKGKVVDAAGETVIGANVLEKGTTNGVITDIDGNFVRFFWSYTGDFLYRLCYTNHKGHKPDIFTYCIERRFRDFG